MKHDGGNPVRVRTELTSARIVLDQELVQSHPAAADSHHHGAAQNPDQTQLLGVAELRRFREETRVGKPSQLNW